MENREFDLEGLKVLIAIPSYSGKIECECMMGIIDAKDALEKAGVEVDVVVQKGISLVQQARNKLANAFMAGQWNRLVWIDDDIGFKRNDLVRLVAFSTEFDIVAGAYPIKNIPMKVKVSPVLKEGRPAQGKYGLLEVEGMPLGFSIMSKNMFQVMSSDCKDFVFQDTPMKEYFKVEVKDGLLWGEDTGFCNQWRATGGKVWCDPSLKLQHIGPYVYECGFYD